jgi:ABC-type Fe3+/spermidine/putrescine transport system ATPase subunit
VKLDGALAGRLVAGRAAPGTTLAPGAEAHVAIRPEDIEVTTTDGVRPGDSALPGVIEALLFVGDRYEARVSLGGEQRILLLLPRVRDWHEGQHVRLGFAAEVASVWPA